MKVFSLKSHVSGTSLPVCEWRTYLSVDVNFCFNAPCQTSVHSIMSIIMVFRGLTCRRAVNVVLNEFRCKLWLINVVNGMIWAQVGGTACGGMRGKHETMHLNHHEQEAATGFGIARR